MLLDIVRRHARQGTGEVPVGPPRFTSVHGRRTGVFASVVLAALWTASCGGGGDSGPVEPQEVNRPPAPTGAIPAQTLTAGEAASVDVASYFSDPDGDALTYGAATSDPAVATVSMSGSALTITGVAQGNATVTVTASDPGGLAAQQRAAVTVVSANQAPEPVGSIPDQTVTAGQTVRVEVASYFSDPNGDPLTYGAATSDAAVAAVSMSGSTLTITGVAQGNATVTVTASDPGGLSTQQRAAVTVSSANQAPQPVGSIPDQTVTAGQTVRVEVASYFSDPNGDPLTYGAATTDVAIAAASISGSTLTIAGVAPGGTTVTVTASDPGGLSTQQRVAVTVVGTNQAPQPVGSIPDQTVTAGQTVMIEAALYFSDPDGDMLTYSAATSSAAVAVPSVAGATVTIAGIAQGSAVVTLTASDPGGLSATQDIAVTVGVRSLDRAALVALYEATGGDFYWDIDTNWLSDRPLGTWYGVTTDEDGRVVELSLPSNTLWGPMPREIVHLQRLKRLDLSDNRVEGELPPEVGDLRDLEELNLSENIFLGSGSAIPAALGKLERLQTLNLSGTGFTEAIPRELGNLRSLARLEFVEMTWLSGPIPPEFGQLANLRHLDVSGSGSLQGALPQELTGVRLEFFHWNRTRLCAPTNPEFQAWLGSIADHQEGRACR